MFPPVNIPTLLCSGAVVSAVAIADRQQRAKALSAGRNTPCVECNLPFASILSRSASSHPTSSSSSLPQPVLGDLAIASAPGITKAEVGRASWFFLHSVAANFPDKPTKQQQKDAKALVSPVFRAFPLSSSIPLSHAL